MRRLASAKALTVSPGGAALCMKPPDSSEDAMDAVATGATLAELRSVDARQNAEAWERAYPLLWDVAMRLLGGLLRGAEHSHDREDLAAQALSEVVRGVIARTPESFNRIATFDDLRNVTLRIVRTRTFDFFRRRARHPEELSGTPAEPQAELSGAGPPLALTREEFDVLIAGLPPPQPEIFYEHYVLGSTAAEIAARRNMPRGTVLSHLHRGKKTLRGQLRLLFGTIEDSPSHPESDRLAI